LLLDSVFLAAIANPKFKMVLLAQRHETLHYLQLSPNQPRIPTNSIPTFSRSIKIQKETITAKTTQFDSSVKFFKNTKPRQKTSHIKDDDRRNEIKLIFVFPSRDPHETIKRPFLTDEYAGDYTENHFDGRVEKEISMTAKSYCLCIYVCCVQWKMNFIQKKYFNKTRGSRERVERREDDGNVLGGS
jgi:hypothetical protein